MKNDENGGDRMNREDFPILDTGIIYFDSAATSLKPRQVIEAMDEYYYQYSANINRGDYKIGLKASEEYEKARAKVASFIHADNKKEIVFTKGATSSLNQIVFGFMNDYLNPSDEVLITKAEHASNILPWLELERKKKIKVVFVPLDDNHELQLETLKKYVTDKTKVISLAAVTNVVGDVRPIHEIGAFCKEHNILFVVDGAQSVAHRKTDVKEDNIDFLVFSGHKMLGPTGIGVLYAKEKYLEAMRPLEYGGGMNQDFDDNLEITYKDIPERLEAGTPPIAEAIGLKAAIEYLEKIGMDNIYQYECELKKYLLERIVSLNNAIIYNPNTPSGILSFNLKGIFSQDTSMFLDSFQICVRAGSHCAKALKDELNIKNTCRISFYFYNTKEEIDKLIEVLKNSDDLYKVIL